MYRNGGWDIRVRNQYGNYLDEFGQVSTPANTHGIGVFLEVIDTRLDMLRGSLERKRFFAECLLHDLRLVRFGFGVDLVFNDVWEPGGQVRADVLDRPVLTSLRLMGVQSLTLTGGLTPGMIGRPDLIDWGLSEIARVEPGESPAGLRLSVRWEGERRIDIEFHGFELEA